jgi:hypothetical protein
MSETEPALALYQRPRFKQWVKRLSISAVVLLVLYQVPLLPYLWRIGSSLNQQGLNNQAWTEIKQHSAWFERYFTGPPSDKEMFEFFYKHRETLERLAYLYSTEQCRMHLQDEPCKTLEQKIGMQVSTISQIHNTAFQPQNKLSCFSYCHGQNYEFTQEYQNWWRSTSLNVEAWTKGLIYIPPLLPAEKFNLPKHITHNRNEFMRIECGYLKKSLDKPVIEIEEKWQSDGCGYRPIVDGWFVVQRAHYVETRWF